MHIVQKAKGAEKTSVEVDASLSHTVSLRLQSLGCDGRRSVGGPFKSSPLGLSDNCSTPDINRGCWCSSVSVRYGGVGTGAQMFPGKLLLEFSCRHQAVHLVHSKVLMAVDGLGSHSQQSCFCLVWVSRKSFSFSTVKSEAFVVIVKMTTTIQ